MRASRRARRDSSPSTSAPPATETTTAADRTPAIGETRPSARPTDALPAAPAVRACTRTVALPAAMVARAVDTYSWPLLLRHTAPVSTVEPSTPVAVMVPLAVAGGMRDTPQIAAHRSSSALPARSGNAWSAIHAR